jgi:4-amino-4-deoxy-L-arabinose transferase-like glycosyltransferase
LRALLVLGTSLTVILYYMYPNAVPDYRADQAHDSFAYITFAKGFLAHQPYPVKHWHPGFPVLLAGALAVVGLDFLRLKLLMITLGLITAIASVRFFRDFGLPHAAPAMALLFAAGPLFFDYSHRLMSEVPFLALLVLTLAAFTALQRGGGERRQWSAGVLMGFSAAAALLVRGNAIALVPTFAVAAFTARGPTNRVRRRFLAAAVAILVAVYSAWALWGASHNFEGIANVTYLEELRAVDLDQLWDAGGLQPGVERISPHGLMRRVYQNVVWHQAFNVDAVVWPGAAQLAGIRTAGVGFAIGLLALVPALIGSVIMVRFSLAIVVYLLCSLLLVIVYPTGGAARMLMPVIPVLLVAYYLGFEFILGRRGALALVIFAAFANLFLCAAEAHTQSRSPYAGEATADVIATIIEDVPTLVPPQDVVVTEYDLVVHALTDRHAVSPRAVPAHELVHGAAYVLDRRSHPIELPSNLTREVVASHGEAQLSVIR